MLNKITQGDSLEVLRSLGGNSIDLTVTSPPYDNLRKYNGFAWDFDGIAKELYRITKDGGIVVWIVGDKTVKGSETLTSFNQAIYFKSIGFNIHDTMIYKKQSPPPQTKTKRYTQSFEYMFVLAKGSPSVCNYLMEDCKDAGRVLNNTQRLKDGTTRGFVSNGKKVNNTKIRGNIWTYDAGFNRSTKDKIAFEHPAIFPEKLAEEHILSWSNPGDVVLDCFGGSGTTAKMALLNNRDFIHIDVSEEYCEIARQRIADALQTEVDGL